MSIRREGESQYSTQVEKDNEWIKINQELDTLLDGAGLNSNKDSLNEFIKYFQEQNNNTPNYNVEATYQADKDTFITQIQK